jgi:hypothetical protein
VLSVHHSHCRTALASRNVRNGVTVGRVGYKAPVPFPHPLLTIGIRNRSYLFDLPNKSFRTHEKKHVASGNVDDDWDRAPAIRTVPHHSLIYQYEGIYTSHPRLQGPSRRTHAPVAPRDVLPVPARLYGTGAGRATVALTTPTRRLPIDTFTLPPRQDPWKVASRTLYRLDTVGQLTTITLLPTLLRGLIVPLDSLVTDRNEPPNPTITSVVRL